MEKIDPKSGMNSAMSMRKRRVCGHIDMHLPLIRFNVNPDQSPLTERSTLDPINELPSAVQLRQNDPLVGTTLGDHLQIISCLGAGGMSVVYKAKDLLLNRTVAVKILHSHSALNPKNVLRFRQEAMAASKIDHPNVIRIYEFNVPEDGQPYLVMDYIEGQSLAELIASNGPIEVQRAISLMGIICDGLQCAHEAGVIHRDLKPGNIMLLKDSSGKQTLKIVDFGIAKLLTENDQGHALTQTGEVFGSPLYMSPEQCWGKQLDGRSDIYALGCVMYEMCTGQAPIKGGSMLETIQMQTTEIPQPVITINPGIKYGENLDRVLLKALDKDPNQRYQTPLEFKQGLQGIRLEDSSSTRQGSIGTRNLYKLSKRAILGLIGLALLATVSGGYFLNKSSNKSSIQTSTVPTTGMMAHTVQPPGNEIGRRKKRKALNNLGNKAVGKNSNDIALKDISQHANIAALDFTNSAFSDDGLRRLTNLPDLTYLQINQSRISKTSGKVIALLPLTVLNLEGTPIDDSFLTAIQKLPLNSLSVRDNHITNRGLASIAKMSSLIDLNVGENDIDDTGLRQLTRLQLTTLRITGTKISDAGLKTVIAMPLRMLVCRDNHIGEKGAQYLGQMKDLEKLLLDGTNITDEGIKSLKNLHSLSELSLNNTRITDKSTPTLTSFRMLKKLNLKHTQVTDEGLKILADAPELQTLDLSETAITDKGLIYLSKLKTLKSLFVKDCPQLTQPAILLFRKGPARLRF
jgi:serine/threonine protein kinase